MEGYPCHSGEKITTVLIGWARLPSLKDLLLRTCSGWWPSPQRSHQGDAGADCFVIVEGTAGVFINGEFVTSLSSGTMVGEMALVDHRPRTATVMAETEMKMLRFHARQFRRLLDEMPKASERVMTLLHDRLTKDG